jgi:fibronectin type 3 domain-containing protein
MQTQQKITTPFSFRKYCKFILLTSMFFLFAESKAQNILPPTLTCVINDFVGSNITIEWQNVNNPCGAFVSYNVYAANSVNGPYTLIATITNQAQTTYIDSGALTTNQTWFYYMEAEFNCPGFTPLQSDTIQNESNPKVPAIISASVNPDNSVTFTWAPSASPQTQYYIVYAYLPGGGVVALDTV